LLVSSNKRFTPQEKARILRKAQAKGLPIDWTVECNNKSGRKAWISPTGRKYHTLPEALFVSSNKRFTLQEKATLSSAKHEKLVLF
jgi:hypothetical protein